MHVCVCIDTYVDRLTDRQDRQTDTHTERERERERERETRTHTHTHARTHTRATKGFFVRMMRDIRVLA